ncbi:diacylglycerol kinase family protein [Saccharomonospora sp. NPDC046836]|uniref:diacylglycerol/lipid kinase family protein n=1 Tax=Saccharomonospora sp. NPDC046836 TaxID=3156921 RepID=UPI00340AA48C
MSSSQARPSPARRAYAAGALLALAAAFVAGIVALVRHPVQLVLAVLLIGVAVAAAWAALVRRGVRRVAAAVLAAVAIVATAALPDLRAYLLFLLIIALLLLTVAAASLALGDDLAPPVAAHPVGPAHNGVLLMNPRSGGGKVARFELESRARSMGVQPVVLTPGDDLRALAERAAATGADVLGMAGGDGSQAVVADVARQYDLPFVCVPAGTRNHFALDLGLDRDNVAAALEAFGQAVERRIDLATVGERVFVNNASLGVYAIVVQSAGYREAKVATVAQRLPELLGPDVVRPDLRFTGPDQEQHPPADVVLVSNGPYRLDNLTGFGSRPRLDSGLLGIATVTLDRARDIPVLVSAEMTGRLARFRGYRSWAVPEFVVDSNQPLVEVGVDGEALRLPPPLRFRTLPGALRVRLPLSAPGPSAAAAESRWATVLALFRIVGGHPARAGTFIRSG